jgi:hypothetical protein
MIQPSLFRRDDGDDKRQAVAVRVLPDGRKQCPVCSGWLHATRTPATCNNCGQKLKREVRK